MYNNIPFSAATSLPQALQIMRAGSVQKILLSFGGAGNSGDWAHMGSQWSTFSTALVSLVKTYGLDGIDIDIEGGMPSAMDTLVKLANFSVSNGWTLTGAPCCGDNGNWATLLARTALPKKCAFDWLNLQTYGGGAAGTVRRGIVGVSYRVRFLLCPVRPSLRSIAMYAALSLSSLHRTRLLLSCCRPNYFLSFPSLHIRAALQYVSWQKSLANACPTSASVGFIVPGSEVQSTNTAAAESQVIASILNGGGSAMARGLFIWDYR